MKDRVDRWTRDQVNSVLELREERIVPSTAQPYYVVEIQRETPRWEVVESRVATGRLGSGLN
jgi:hypothetical protein